MVHSHGARIFGFVTSDWRERQLDISIIRDKIALMKSDVLHDARTSSGELRQGESDFARLRRVCERHAILGYSSVSPPIFAGNNTVMVSIY